MIIDAWRREPIGNHEKRSGRWVAWAHLGRRQIAVAPKQARLVLFSVTSFSERLPWVLLTTFGVAATAASTDRDLSDHEALRFQWTVSSFTAPDPPRLLEAP